MSNENKQPAAVRVCAISDVECSRGCGTGACKKESAHDHIAHDRKLVAQPDERAAFTSALILAICELPDRTSPEDEPGAMVANADEIAGCVECACENAGLRIVSEACTTAPQATVKNNERRAVHDVGGRMVSNVETPEGFAVECVSDGSGITRIVVRAAVAQAGATLTDEQIEELFKRETGFSMDSGVDIRSADLIGFARALLAATPQAPVADAARAEPARTTDRVNLDGWQLLEALNYLAPDRDTDPDQLDGDVTIQFGNGHSGEALYCWNGDYPDDGAFVLDGSTVDRDTLAHQLARASEAGEASAYLVTGIDRFCEQTASVWIKRAAADAASALLSNASITPLAPLSAQQAVTLTDDATIFADDHEREQFVRAVDQFEDCGETDVGDELLMKWAASGLMQCTHFEVTPKGDEALAALQSHSEGEAS